MFARPRVKLSLAPPSKKRKLASAIEEIKFDTTEREDYLTGFHKRKLQRIKHAKEEAAKREREERLATRKTLRESRKADIERHVEAVNSMLREQRDVVSDSSEPETADQDEKWEGIAEGALDHEDEYFDDDRFTTVTVEAVDVSKDGLHKAHQDDGEGSNATDTDIKQAKSSGSPTRERKDKGRTKRIWSKEPPKGAKKKKKFRYESKADRKVTRFKERSGNKVKAKTRKSA